MSRSAAPAHRRVTRARRVMKTVSTPASAAVLGGMIAVLSSGRNTTSS